MNRLISESSAHESRTDATSRDVLGDGVGLDDGLSGPGEAGPWDRFAELSLDLMGTANADGFLVELNPAWESALGRTRSELRSQPWLSFVHPDDVDPTLTELQLLSVSGATHSFRLRFLHGDGRPLWFSWTARQEGSIIYAIGREVPGEESMQAQLVAQQRATARAEAQLRTLVGSMAEGAIFRDADGVTLECNPAGAALLGIERHQIIGKKALPDGWEYYAEDGGPADLSARPGDIALRTGGEARATTWGVRAPGRQIVWLSVVARAVHDNEGRLLGVVVTFHDVTALRQAEAQLRASRDQLEAVVEAAGDAILWLLPCGLVARANRAAEELFGLCREAIEGTALSDLFAADERELVAGKLAEASAANAATWARFDAEGVAATQRRFSAEITLRALRSGDEVSGLTAVIRDVSARRRLERSQRDFVAIVNHELRTPLTSIRGSLALLAHKRAEIDAERLSLLIEVSHRNSERLSRLVDDILDVQAIETGTLRVRMQPLDLASVLQHVVDSSRPLAAQAGVELTIAEVVAGPILTDGDRLTQIVTNLLSNAIKFSPVGGTIRVWVRPAPDEVTILVGDEGPGVPPELRNRIFDRFERFDVAPNRTDSGVGLGLFIARSLAEYLGGSVGFEPEERGGSVFWVRLPRSAGLEDEGSRTTGLRR